MTSRAKKLEGKQGEHGSAHWNHPQPGQTGRTEDLVQRERCQGGQEQEETPEPGAQVPGAKIELTDVSNVGRGGLIARRPVLLGASRQASESFIHQHNRDGHRTQRAPILLDGTADIINREILLLQGDDLLANQIGLGGLVGSFVGRLKEGASGAAAELMDKDPKASPGISEALGDFGSGETIDEEGAQRLVLAVSRIGRLEEYAGEVC